MGLGTTVAWMFVSMQCILYTSVVIYSLFVMQSKAKRRSKHDIDHTGVSICTFLSFNLCRIVVSNVLFIIVSFHIIYCPGNQ